MAFPRARVYINELVCFAVKNQTDAGCLPIFCEAFNEMLYNDEYVINQRFMVSCRGM